MAVYEIPLDAKAQRFRITLAAVEYQLTLFWNDAPEGDWTINIADTSGNPIIKGIPLVTGADLLAQYAYLGIGGSLHVLSDSNLNAAPTYENLGTTAHLYFVTP